VNKPFFRINHQINATEVRLLRENGTQIGVVSLQDALSKSREAGVDLVEVAPAAVPPVAKIIDYKKFLYQLAKKEQAAKSGAKKVELKEVRLTPFMAQNDFDTKIRRSREWLMEGNKVRVSVKFVGRQLGHKEFGDQMMQRVINAVSDIAGFDQIAKWVGKQYMATLSPVKSKSNNNVQTKN